eukprot:CAMPEP_0197173794 /NCGR_PEP_ID=MMETSP1423-20130617/583_1 /TAXON_ID=476441 /ORGANISM="Pseudo-nitzschia heimii, Strain UNC1101" /LENGTH=488 /DNA_ID=CAMNT_0042622657 /DNA_START=666 /DNA_END=2132 /DNA_ORIENTATION=-
MRKSGSCPRFAALALLLFLSSRDEARSSVAFVEAFRTIGRPIIATPIRLAAARHHHQPSSSFRTTTTTRLRVANPKMDDETANAANPVTAESLAEAERAWALDTTANASDQGIAEFLAAASSEGGGGQEKTLSEKLLSADFLGPLASIVFVVSFLFYTLLYSEGISDDFATMDISHKLDVLSKICWLPGQFNEAKVVVGFVMAFSAFAQALTGFGFAVVAVGAMSSMPWLLHSELYDVITPVAATLGALVGFIILIPYAFPEGPATEENPGLDWGEILPLLIPCTVLTPLGIQLNSMVDPVLATRILAGLIMAFVGYKLVPTIQGALGGAEEEQPEEEKTVLAATASGSDAVEVIVENDADDAAPDFLQSRTAAILFGSAAGIFGGAFDVQGPPLCVYGDAKGWSPARFRNNVLAVVCLNSAFVVAIDFFEGALGDFYYPYFCLTSLPGVLLGVVAGQYASERIDPVLFKNLVLVMCLGLGIQLLRVS